MPSKPGLYPHFRPLRTHPSEERIRKINLIIHDINFNHLLMTDQLFHTKIFPEEEIDRCFDYITSGIDDIYLFIPNTTGNIFIQTIREFPQIKSIYILCKDQQYQNYSDPKHKLRIFNDFDTMFKQFQDDINKLYYSEQITFQDFDGESGEILWWIFFHKILLDIPNTNIAKEEFMALFKEFFQNNQSISTLIEEFKSNYTSDKAINLYTQPLFHFDLVNQTLRAKNNFNNIFKIRLLLTDIISSLKTENSKYNSCIKSFTVYRGQKMKLEEIQQLKLAIGNLIYFNQFLSTTLNREKAHGFAYISRDPCCSQHVLFTIEIDSLDINSDTTLFANIAIHSDFVKKRFYFRYIQYFELYLCNKMQITFIKFI